MDIKKEIVKIITAKKRATSAGIRRALPQPVSRQYVGRILKSLVSAGTIVKIGSTRSAFYVSPSNAARFNQPIKKRLTNKNLKEDEVLKAIERDWPGINRAPENIQSILRYAFSEMLNNAIEHSKSKSIEIEFNQDSQRINFNVNDFGIGVFRNIMQQRNLASELEAIQDLLKGKTTTQPHAHTGEGIFFTSKVADTFSLASFNLKLIIDNTVQDVFVEELKPSQRGTRVQFSIDKKSKKSLNQIFQKYTTPGTHEFNKSEIKIKLYVLDTAYVSRSQARRLLEQLDKFKTIILDFDKVKTIGQAFADEIFRVWQRKHPAITITPVNTNQAVQFMINRAVKK